MQKKAVWIGSDTPKNVTLLNDENKIVDEEGKVWIHVEEFNGVAAFTRVDMTDIIAF